MTAAEGLSADFLDMLDALEEAGVAFLIVGAHAMAVHGVPRATGDLDIFVEPTAENAVRVTSALRLFGAPLEVHGVDEGDFAQPGTVYQLGLPPRRIDVMTAISGVPFRQAWESRVEVEVEGRRVPFLGRQSLIENKRASGRKRDLLDLELLVETEEPESPHCQA